ncbi:MAG: haloalkane dehalogenase [Alphaproteobacteria bacterium]
MSPTTALSTQPLPHKTVTVDGLSMAYVDLPADLGAKSGRTLVFQHGNPTSSFLWRNIMPSLTGFGRCIAVDLVGMGNSDKLPDSGPDRYTFTDHRHFLDGALDALEIGNDVVWVIHDWGSALGFHWAHRHPERVSGLCYMEGIPAVVPTWDDWPEAARGVFQGFRSENGEAMVLEKNVFVERVLPGSILRSMTDAEMDVYRAPFTQPGEDRRPTLTWPRQIPIAGEPADVVEIVTAYQNWLTQTHIPKLFINAEPGAILTGKARDFCRTFPAQTEVTVKGSHFIQEDSPHEIAAAVRDWLTAMGD